MLGFSVACSFEITAGNIVCDDRKMNDISRKKRLIREMRQTCTTLPVTIGIYREISGGAESKKT